MGALAYWDVRDLDAVAAEWINHGAAAHRGPRTVMTGERLCQLRDPSGNCRNSPGAITLGIGQGAKELVLAPGS